MAKTELKEVLKALIEESDKISFTNYPRNPKDEVQILLGDWSLVLHSNGTWELQ